MYYLMKWKFLFEPLFHIKIFAEFAVATEKEHYFKDIKNIYLEY